MGADKLVWSGMKEGCFPMEYDHNLFSCKFDLFFLLRGLVIKCSSKGFFPLRFFFWLRKATWGKDFNCKQINEGMTLGKQT